MTILMGWVQWSEKPWRTPADHVTGEMVGCGSLKVYLIFGVWQEDFEKLTIICNQQITQVKQAPLMTGENVEREQWVLTRRDLEGAHLALRVGQLNDIPTCSVLEGKKKVS